MRPPLNTMVLRKRSYGNPNPRVGIYGVRSIQDTDPVYHAGWDLLASSGTPVFAIADGWARTIQSPSYGMCVSLGFQFRQGIHYYWYWALYAHLSASLVAPGARVWVSEGTRVGMTGKSGTSARGLPPREAHLHFEISSMETRHHWTDRAAKIEKYGKRHKLWGTIDPGKVLGYIHPLTRPVGDRYTVEPTITAWSPSRVPVPFSPARDEYTPGPGVRPVKPSDWLNK